MELTYRVLLLLSASCACRNAQALQNLFPSWNQIFAGAAIPSAAKSPASSSSLLEDELISAIEDHGNRLANSERIGRLINQLESTKSILEPAMAPEVYGRWRLIYTTNADTSSPIQRKAVDTQAFPIYQDIVIDSEICQVKVKQIVQFSDSITLSVDALASTAAYPLPELSERRTTGKVLGLNLLGVSLVGEQAKPDATRPNSRIDFVFDEGKFEFQNGAFSLPYPVPFRSPLFRDWVKGWIDITYLSDRVRVSRGNKGTTFVLVKDA